MGQQIVGLLVLFCRTMLCGIFRGPRHLCAGEKDGGGNFARRVKFFINFAVAATGKNAVGPIFTHIIYKIKKKWQTGLNVK